MLTEQAKETIKELALIEVSGAKNLLVAAFVEFCCPGATQMEKAIAAVTEVNQVFDSNYEYRRVREWTMEVRQNARRTSRCPEHVAKHMQWRLIMSITPGSNDDGTIALLKILGLPFEAAEFALKNTL